MKTGVPKFPKIYLVVALLVAIFVLAIFYRGSSAIQGILWMPDDKCNPTVSLCDSEVTVINWGAYDPEGALEKVPNITLDHHYGSWLDLGWLRSRIASGSARGREIFISLEPWPKAGSEESDLLSDISAGKYDSEITEVCGVLKSYPKNVFISFGHEMDHDLTKRYPWSARPAGDFISAFRYFTEKCKGIAPDVRSMWSPVGDKKATEYWPGPQYVDVIGVPVYSFPDFDIHYYGHARSFAESFGEKYERVKIYDKPIMIVELGVAGNISRKTEWLTSAKKTFSNFPLLTYVILFNSKDTEGVWGKEFSTPDWRIEPGMLF